MPAESSAADASSSAASWSGDSSIRSPRRAAIRNRSLAVAAAVADTKSCTFRIADLVRTIPLPGAWNAAPAEEVRHSRALCGAGSFVLPGDGGDLRAGLDEAELAGGALPVVEHREGAGAAGEGGVAREESAE